MQVNFVDMHAQYQAYKPEIDQAIAGVLDSCKFIMGPEVAELEQKLSEFTGCAHSIGCASGTDALMLALMAIDAKPGDEVITTPFTFIATGEIIALLGLKPIYVDIEEDTYNIDPSKIAEKITNKTKAIIPVSLYGQPSDMTEINAIAKQYSEKLGHKIYVIEDAAQSFGAEYQGEKSCNLSELSCTSFFPAKPLGCYGDGGAVFTTNDELAAKMKSLRVHGQTKRYHHDYIGFNGRLDTIQAAILLVKLKHFPVEIKKRQAAAVRYNELLKDSGAILPTVKSDRSSTFAQYTIRVRNRDELREQLSAQGIPSAVHYPKPLHLQPCFVDCGFKEGDFPTSEKMANEVMSLPMCAFLTEENQRVVTSIVMSLMKEKQTV